MEMRRSLKILKLLFDLKKAPLQTEEQKCDFIKAKFIFGFILTVFVVGVSYYVADAINTYFPLEANAIKIIQIVSEGMTVMGCFGHIGWDIGSWNKELKAELLERKISSVLFTVGIMLTFSSYHLVPLT